MRDLWIRALERGLEQLGIGLEQRALSALDAYVQEIELFNPTYRLIGGDLEQLIDRHLLDSLAPLPYILPLLSEFEAPKVADVGSGNGMPGIPLAIMLEGLKMVLIERSAKRVGFLQNAVTASGLSDRVSILCSDLSEVSESFDLLVFRAFRPLSDLFGQLDRVTNPGGCLLAYKGRIEAVSQELEETPLIGQRGYGVRTVSYLVPGSDAERTLLILRKPR